MRDVTTNAEFGATSGEPEIHYQHAVQPGVHWDGKCQHSEWASLADVNRDFDNQTGSLSRGTKVLPW
jgi:hypothetical protein